MNTILVVFAALADVHRDLAGETELMRTGFAGECSLFLIVYEDAEFADCGWAGQVRLIAL